MNTAFRDSKTLKVNKGPKTASIDQLKVVRVGKIDSQGPGQRFRAQKHKSMEKIPPVPINGLDQNEVNDYEETPGRSGENSADLRL